MCTVRLRLCTDRDRGCVRFIRADHNTRQRAVIDRERDKSLQIVHNSKRSVPVEYAMDHRKSGADTKHRERKTLRKWRDRLWNYMLEESRRSHETRLLSTHLSGSCFESTVGLRDSSCRRKLPFVTTTTIKP